MPAPTAHHRRPVAGSSRPPASKRSASSSPASRPRAPSMARSSPATRPRALGARSPRPRGGWCAPSTASPRPTGTTLASTLWSVQALVGVSSLPAALAARTAGSSTALAACPGTCSPTPTRSTRTARCHCSPRCASATSSRSKSAASTPARPHEPGRRPRSRCRPRGHGAILVYCGGCVGAIGAGTADVGATFARRIGAAPFLGAATFGEQGCFPGTRSVNRHGNLMCDALFFLLPVGPQLRAAGPRTGVEPRVSRSSTARRGRPARRTSGCHRSRTATPRRPPPATARSRCSLASRVAT